MAGRMNGRVTLVTGAAKGIGASIARRLVEEGAPVALADVDDTRGSSLSDELQAAGGKTMFVALDVTEETDWENSIETVIDRFGGLDVLVNNAGITGPIQPVDEISADDWRNVLAVNLAI